MMALHSSDDAASSKVSLSLSLFDSFLALCGVSVCIRVMLERTWPAARCRQCSIQLRWEMSE